MTPIGTNSSGMPSSARSPSGSNAPAKPEARPASTAASMMTIMVAPMSTHQ
jgi:hypothetical protein